MYTVKIAFYTLIAAVGAALLVLMLLVVLPSMIELQIKLAGNCARYKLGIRPLCLPIRIAQAESVTLDSSAGLVFCGSEKRFGKPVLGRQRKESGALIKALIGSFPASVKPVRIGAVGTLAASDAPDRAALAAGSIRTAAAMLVTSCPGVDVGVCVVPDPTSPVSRIDMRVALKLRSGRLLINTIKNLKDKGDKSK